METFMQKHPPEGEYGIIQFAVPVFKAQKAYDHEAKGMKVYMRFRNHADFPLTGDYSREAFENFMVGMLKKAGGQQLYGQAPRGSLERRIQTLIDELGI